MGIINVGSVLASVLVMILSLVVTRALASRSLSAVAVWTVTAGLLTAVLLHLGLYDFLYEFFFTRPEAYESPQWAGNTGSALTLMLIYAGVAVYYFCLYSEAKAIYRLVSWRVKERSERQNRQY